MFHIPLRALGLGLLLNSTTVLALDVAEIGSFHIGGEQVTLSGLPLREIVFSPGAPPFTVDPNGDFEVGQMYVQYVKLADPKARYPLLMWHGGGLTGAMWETKPDGQPGWQWYFLNAGHDVYVSDAVERGRASWASFPEIYTSEPFFRTKKEGWELFRIGPEGSYDSDPAERRTIDGQQFPVDAFDQFMKQGVPRWTTNDELAQKAYNELVQRVCPCVLLVFSQSSNFGSRAALSDPDKIKAVVAIEPSGAVNPEQVDLTPLSAIPHLFIFGDNLDQGALWQGIVPNIRRYYEGLEAVGTDVTWVSLPERGITGNTHMMMMDRNSDQIAELIQQWLSDKGLVEP